MEILESELWKLTSDLEPNPEVPCIVKEVEEIARTVIPQARACLFGSQAAGLSLEGSDIDIVVLSQSLPNVRSNPTEKPILIEYMHLFVQAHQAVDFRSSLQVRELITHANVPIIRCETNKGTKRKCDISFGIENGVQAAQMMKAEITAQPSIRPLLLVLKQLLKERGLNEVYTGGLSSYSLFHLVLAYFANSNSEKDAQQQKNVNSEFPYFENTCSALVTATVKTSSAATLCSKSTLAEQLLDLLDYYSRRFDTVTQAVHGRRGAIPKSSARVVRQDRDYTPAAVRRLCIVDVLDPENDVSRGSFQYEYVLRAFGDAANTLRKAVREAESGARNFVLPSILRECASRRRVDDALGGGSAGGKRRRFLEEDEEEGGNFGGGESKWLLDDIAPSAGVSGARRGQDLEGGGRGQRRRTEDTRAGQDLESKEEGQREIVTTRAESKDTSKAAWTWSARGGKAGRRRD